MTEQTTTITAADRERAREELAFLRSLTDPMTGRLCQPGEVH